MELLGECVTKRFYTLRNNTKPIINVDVPINPLPGCCNDFVLKVLADNTNIAEQNDKNTVIYWFDKIVTNATMHFKKWSDGDWKEVAVITDNTYGKYGSFGYYTNNYGQKFISIEIDWAKVLLLQGAGSYKVTTEYTLAFGGNDSVDSYEFCLNNYTPQRADGTVRLEYWLSGQTGDIEDDKLVKDYGTLNIYNTLRVNGYFGYPKSTYKEETIDYANTGQTVFVEDEQLPTYKMKLRLLPFFIHEIIRTDFMQADTLAVTDYNSRNNARYVTKYLRKDSGYEPKWYDLSSNLATVELQFKPQYNRFRKLR